MSTKSVLTSRQTQILKLIAHGKGGKEIAWDLHISLKTVEFHRRCLQERLNLHGIAELIRYAIKQGLA